MILFLMLGMFHLVSPSAHADWKIDRALTIAEGVWHPACGELSVHLGDPVAEGTVAEAGGWARADDCEIGLDAGRTWTEFEPLCQVILHEGGHVAGRSHSNNPRSVMRPSFMFGESTATIGGVTSTRWDGIDRRCMYKGRWFLAILRSRGLA
jgi:hypothetical protein